MMCGNSISDQMRTVNAVLDHMRSQVEYEWGATNRPTVDNPHRTVTLREILCTVLERLGISQDEAESARRSRKIVLARQMYCLLARELTDKSYHRIGMLLGNRDHTTVLYAARAARERAAADPEYAEHYAYCMRKLGRLL